MQARATSTKAYSGPRKRLSMAARAAAIFAAAAVVNAPAASYDFSNMASLFQDATGMTPVTTVEQPIGFVTDQSRGGAVRGPDLMKNPTFTTADGWNLQPTAAVVNNQLVLTAAAPGVIQASNAVNVVIGRLYEVTFDLISFSTGGVSVGTGGGGVGTPRNAPGTYREVIVASAVAIGVYARSTTTNAVVDNVSVRELTAPNIWTGTPTTVDPSWTVAGNVYTADGTNGFIGWASGAGSKLIIGQTYECIVRVNSYTSGQLYLPYDGAGASNTARASGVGLFRRIFVAGNSSLWMYSALFVGSVDLVAVNLLPGNHVAQTTTTARPFLDGRVNQILQTEALANAAWTKLGAGTGTAPVVTDAFGLAPDGTMTASRVQMALNGGTTVADQSVISQVVAGIAPNSILSSGVWLKTNDGTTKQVTMRDDLATPSVAPVLNVTGTWQFFSTENRSTQTGATNSASVKLWLRGAQGTSDSADLLMWHPQFEFGPALGKYQKVATGDVYDLGFPLTARFDGVDDALTQTFTTFNLANTPVITGFIAMRITGATYSNPFNQGSTATADGNWGLTINDTSFSGLTLIYRRGNGTQQYKNTAIQVGVPRSALIAFSVDAADVAVNSGLTLMESGSPIATGSGAAQTVRTGFGTEPLQIGRRGAATQPFKGNIARIDFIGRRLTPDDMYVFHKLHRQQLLGNLL